MNDPTPPPPAPYNPYLAPQQYAPPPQSHFANVAVAAGAPIKWLYLAATAGLPLAVAFFAILMAAGVPRATVTALAGGIDGLIGLAHIVLAFIWIHTVWTALPVEHREGTTPGGAVGALFNPFYNLVWAFQLNTTLCRGFDAMLEARGMRAQAPRTLAVVAPAVHLVSRLCAIVANVGGAPDIGALAAFVANVLWTIYMFRVDRVRTTLASA